MASLKSLTLTVLPQIQADPVMDRRNRTIAHLEARNRVIKSTCRTFVAIQTSGAEGSSTKVPAEVIR